MEENRFISIVTGSFSIDKERAYHLISMSLLLFMTNSCMKPCCCVTEKEYDTMIASLLLQTVYDDTINKEEIAFVFYFIGVIYRHNSFKAAIYYLIQDILFDDKDKYDSRVRRIRERLI